MKREILINAAPRETRIAILEDGKLVELLDDRPDNRRMVGDIYLGRVDAVLPGIQAAFVDIGTEKSAFLHASDLVRQTADEAEDEDEDDDDESDEPVEKKNENGGNGSNRRPAKRPPRQSPSHSGSSEARPGHTGPDLQGTDLDQGSAGHGADFTCRPIPCLHPRLIEGGRQPEDRIVDRAGATEGAGPEHSSRQIRWRDRPDRKRRRDARDAPARAQQPHVTMEEDQAKDALPKSALAGKSRKRAHSRTGARHLQRQGGQPLCRFEAGLQ